ncbi:hypothetical protein [Aquabacterium sp. CECT 9606]|uniref:hypothetical protein n=1 Tax=Aquabacterium sp. CECT 9606 TaxID=2845822 RepID=UPI001E5A760D|nr:hypothetical protein [Aquabacterium sp. CECT 9606]CAH0350148.1 hypothetical protein AQB9606_01429 [Aquabacterium sp. CECT 9606]
MDPIEMTTPPGDNSSELSLGRIDGWPDFIDRVRAAMAVAAAHPVPLYLCDGDFSRWPLGERSVMEAFHQWGLNSRITHCTVVAASLDELPRRHPRWVAWRGTWAHRVKCFLADPDQAPSLMPTLVLEKQLGLRLLDPISGRGLWSRRPSDLSEWRQEADVILQRCSEALPPTTLGL